METMDDFREELEASFKKIRVGDVTAKEIWSFQRKRPTQSWPGIN